MKKKPNILFLLADDMRYDTINYLGNSEVITPTLDELASNGTCFTNANIPGGSCAAICMPSRAMLNTSKSLFKLTDHGASIPDRHALVGECFGNAGYNTFGTGKWHNGYTSYARSFSDGGEIFFGGMYDHWKVPVYDYDDTGNYVKQVNDVMNPGYSNNMVPVRMNHVTWGKHSTDLFADLACKWIEDYNDDKPFFMYVSYMAPHDPRSMPQEFFDLYDADNLSLTPNVMSEHPFDFGIKKVRDEQLEDYPRTMTAIKEHLRDYYAMISHLDASVGRIIESLKKSDQLDNTIIVFTADNGLGLGEHGLMGKQNCYEHSIKVPLIFYGKGVPKNEKRGQLVYLMDIFPTLCDLAEIQHPTDIDGKSMFSLFNDSQTTTRDNIFFVYRDKIRGVKTEKYKLIEYKYANQQWVQLFDLTNDPYEMVNLSGTEGMREIEQELLNLTQKLALAWGDCETELGKRFWYNPELIDTEKFGFI